MKYIFLYMCMRTIIDTMQLFVWIFFFWDGHGKELAYTQCYEFEIA